MIETFCSYACKKCLLFVKIYVIDSADKRRMEETGVELRQLLDEVNRFLSILWLIDFNNFPIFRIVLAISRCSSWRINKTF